MRLVYTDGVRAPMVVMAATLPQAKQRQQQAQRPQAPARSAGAEDAAPATPRPVTRGEHRNQVQLAKVDWLNATFYEPALSQEGFVALLGRMLGRPVSAVQAGGLLGFRESYKLEAHHGSLRSHIGSLAWGGEGQGGRWLFQLTGHGCGFVTDWDELQCLLESLDAKITRLDLAVDFLEGEHTVDEAVELWHADGFTCKKAGTRPKSSFAGDWAGLEDGRSFYVGKAQNGKMLRVYEKGKQLGDATSEWVRFEVQFGSRDRTIPLDALTRRDAFFAGAYPVLADFLVVAAETIKTFRAAGVVSMGHVLHHMRRSYGKAIDTALSLFACEIAELVQEVRVIGLPRRLNPSSLAAGVSWEDVLSQLRSK